MKKLLSILLALAMILSTVIIPSAFVVGAEEVTVLTEEYYVSTEGNDETGDGSAENPYATIEKAETVAAALENETTIVNATINIIGEHTYGATVAHKGMFTLKGDGTTSSVLKILSGNSHAATGTYGSLLSGPVTIKDIVYYADGNYIVTNGYEYVIDLGALNAPKTNTFAIMNAQGKDEKVTVNNYSSESWIDSRFSVGSTKGAMGGLDFVYNAGRFRSITFNATTYNGNINLTFNGFYTRSEANEKPAINVTEGAVFNKAVQVIFNNNKGSVFATNQLANVNAAEGVWVMNGISTAGTLTTTETAGTFAVNSTGIAQAKNTATGEVYFAENGLLTVPAGEYDFSFGGPAELYVSATGSDETGDGTEANPYATINTAMTKMANNIEGTIYVLGETAVDFDSSVAHTGMITIDGLGTGKINLVTNGWKNNAQTAHFLSGPTKFQNIEIDKKNYSSTYLGTNGYELIFGDNVTSFATDETNKTNHQMIIVGNTANNSSPEKVTINSYNSLNWADGHGTNVTVKPYVENAANGTLGDIDINFNGGRYYRLTIGTGRYTGNVNIAFNGGSRIYGSTCVAFQDGQAPVFEGAVQFLFNNGTSKDNLIGTAFDEVEAANGVWFISSAKDASGSTLETTETAGTFKVNSAATAVATNAEGTEVTSENGLLTLDAGVWNVTYDYRVLYVSETGSDETGNGSEEKPYASISKAMTLLGDKAGTVYVMGSVASSDVAHTGMITLKGYDENATLYIYGSWYNQIYEAWKLQGPTTLENLRLVYTHKFTNPDAEKLTTYKLVTQGQKLVIKDCWTTGNPTIYVGHYQQTNLTTSNELVIDGLAFKDEANVANPASWSGLGINIGSFGDSTSYNTNGINISIKNTNLKNIRMNESKGIIKGDVKIEVDSSVHLTTDGAYWTGIDDSAIDGNFEFISNGKGTTVFTGITPADNDLTHVAVTEGNGIWFMNGAAGSSLETTDTAGSFKVIGPDTAVATNAAGDTVKSEAGILTVPAGTWEVYYETTEVYVSANGSADGDGSKENPILSINEATNMLSKNPEGGTIYVSGAIEEQLTPVAHVGMITIIGVDGTDPKIKYWWEMNPNGPLTIKNVTVVQNGNHPYTNGYEFVIDITKGQETNTVYYNIGTKNTTAEKYNNEKMTVINNTRTYAYNPTNFNIGAGAYTGSVDFIHESGNIKWLTIQNSIFKGNVNITFDSFTQRTDDVSQSYAEKVTEGAVFEKAFQVIYNNNSAANILTTKVFETDAVTAAGGKWVIYGATGGKLRTTDTAGKFTVETTGGLVAVAKAEGTEAIMSEGGILDLTGKPGVYTVEYVDITAMLDAIYVSATEGNDDNLGSEEYPVATFKVALEKAKKLLGDKVIYVMGTVDTLVNDSSDYVTYDEMITVKGYDENSAINLTTTWKNQVNNIYMFQGPTTLEDLRIITAGNVGTNGNEVVINNCYTNEMFSIYVGDHEKTIDKAKVNKLSVNNFEFFNETFTAEAPWLGLTVYYGAFGGDTAQVESGAIDKFTSAGIEVYVNGTNFKAFRLDTSRGYIAGDVKLTVDKAFVCPDKQGGHQTTIGTIDAETGELAQSVAINGSVMVAVNNNVGTKAVTGDNGELVNNLTNITANEGVYFVYSADINGNKVGIGEETGTFDINSPYSVDVKDAEGNVVTRASDVLEVEEGTYYVGYFNAADINADGKLDIRDLVAFKNEFAKAEVKNYAQFDISFDGAVDTADLAALQKHFLKAEEVKFAPVGDDLGFTYFEDIVLTSDEMAEEYKETIFAEDDSNAPKDVTTYYVSSIDADSANLGTEADPFTSIEALNAAFAERIIDDSTTEQAVLFERGSVFRTTESLILDSYTYYGAYGDGPKPQILGSLRDYADASLWTTENGGSIWQLQVQAVEDAEDTMQGLDYAANIVVTKNGVEGVAKRVSTLAAVDTTGEYYYDKATGIVYLFCDFINPANYFDSIEISSVNALIRNYDGNTEAGDKVYNSNFTVENLCVKYAGVHDFALSGVTDSTIQYCEVGWAGGHHTADGIERYGNGIEIWNKAVNVTIANNYIYQAYDAAVTFQGSSTNVYENVVYEYNLIERCSFGFEFWAGTNIDIPADATEEEAAELQAQIDAKLATAVIDEIYFQYNVNRLAAGGMGGACRPYSAYQSFIQPFNMDASKVAVFNVNILENVFDTSYRSFVWATAGKTEQDPIGSTIPLMTFDGNFFVQSGSAPALINGQVCETQADFEDAVYALDENAQMAEWYQ